MALLRDWECECGGSGEILFDSPPGYTEFVHKDCGKTARLVWKSFGPKGRVGGNKGRFPYYDVELGMTLESEKQRKQVAESRGLMIMSREEHKRTMDAMPDNQPDEVPWNSAAWQDSAMKAWNDLKYGNVPDPCIHTTQDVMADVIDTPVKTE